MYIYYIQILIQYSSNNILFFYCRKGINRFLTVYKREGSTIVQADAVIKLQKASKQNICNLTQTFPLNHKECQDLLPPTERERPLNNDGMQDLIIRHDY
jgi:hypothetical protein